MLENWTSPREMTPLSLSSRRPLQESSLHHYGTGSDLAPKRNKKRKERENKDPSKPLTEAQMYLREQAIIVGKLHMVA